MLKHCGEEQHGGPRSPKMRSLLSAASLLHGYVNQIFVFKSQLLRGIVWCDALAIDHEPYLRRLEAEPAAVRVHELSQRSGLLDFELHLAPLLILDLQLNVPSFSHPNEYRNTKLEKHWNSLSPLSQNGYGLGLNSCSSGLDPRLPAQGLGSKIHEFPQLVSQNSTRIHKNSINFHKAYIILSKLIHVLLIFRGPTGPKALDPSPWI